MKSVDVPSSEPTSNQRAFTRIDLLAVIAMTAVLLLALLPARAGSRTKAQSFRCLENLRQLMGAMMMYTHDNHDFYPPNPDDGTTLPGYTWCAGMVYGPPPYDMSTGSATFNPDILADPTRCLLAPYLGTNVSVFRCTADPRMGPYSGPDPAKRGMVVPAARTVSMSGAVGTTDPGFYSTLSTHSGAPTLPVIGVWLDGTRYANKSGYWRTYGKTVAMVVPAPANLLVIAEEDPYSINDALLATSIGRPEWVDWPSTLHNMGCVLSFADGHAELHKWVDSRTRLTGPARTVTVSPSDRDWNWVAQRTSARAR